MGEKYNNYLQSTHWLNFRKTELERANYKCEECASRTDLQVHHLNYRCLNREQGGIDTIVLCRDCHTFKHFPPKTWEEIEAQLREWFPNGWK